MSRVYVVLGTSKDHAAGVLGVFTSPQAARAAVKRHKRQVHRPANPAVSYDDYGVEERAVYDSVNEWRPA